MSDATTKTDAQIVDELRPSRRIQVTEWQNDRGNSIALSTHWQKNDGSYDSRSLTLYTDDLLTAARLLTRMYDRITDRAARQGEQF